MKHIIKLVISICAIVLSGLSNGQSSDAAGLCYSDSTGVMHCQGYRQGAADDVMATVGQTLTTTMLQNGVANYVATVGGTANAITLTPSPTVTGYAAGQHFWFFATATNSGTVTVDISGLGAIALNSIGGTGLKSGDIINGAIVQIVHDGTRLILEGVIRLGANLVGGINEARGSVTQHATAMDLFAVTSPNVLDGTGSAVTLTALAAAPQAGARRTLYPITGTVITHGATFSVEGNANYTTLAGDGLEFEAVTVSTFKVRILKQDGTAVAVVAPGLVLIQAQTASAASSVDFTTGITSTYDEYEIHFDDVTFSNAAGGTAAWLRVSEDAGSTWKSGATDYTHGYSYTGTVSTAFGVGSTGDTKILLSNDLGNSTNAPTSGRIVISKPAGSTNRKMVRTDTWSLASDGNSYRTIGSGSYKGTTNAITGLRVLPSSGTFSGTFRLYGIRKS